MFTLDKDDSGIESKSYIPELLKQNAQNVSWEK